jgi:hypothetical protein
MCGKEGRGQKQSENLDEFGVVQSFPSSLEKFPIYGDICDHIA